MSSPPVHAASELPGLLSTLARGRPLVLHFCATWCTTCRQEFLALHDLFAGLEGRGVSVALIWIDDAPTRDAIPGMTLRYRLEGLPALALDAPDPDAVARLLGEPTWDGTLPATFVYDIHQAKIASFPGAADRAKLEAAVELARPGKR